MESFGVLAILPLLFVATLVGVILLTTALLQLAVGIKDRDQRALRVAGWCMCAFVFGAALFYGLVSMVQNS